MWSAAQIEPSAPEMPGVGDGAGLPFHVCPGLGMLRAGTAISSETVVSEKEEETAHPTCN